MEDTQYKPIKKVVRILKFITLPFKKKNNNLNIKNKKIGFDPRLFNDQFIKYFSNKLSIKCIAVNKNLLDLIKIKKNINTKRKFYVLDKSQTGQSCHQKLEI